MLQPYWFLQTTHSSSHTIFNPKDKGTSNPDHTTGLSAGPWFHSMAQTLSSVHDSAQPPLREVGTELTYTGADRQVLSNPVGALPTESRPVLFRGAEGQKVSMGCLRSGDQHHQKQYRNPVDRKRSEKLESDL
ncbi:hypothetical protein GE21DRAFT_1793 [Neurospora crassa]|uniref:Uncharacterized protein n=2 Tax=Neurospora crassa TaxID=5141 RepID=Q7SCH9_NEUCR|nr:hypothetical protein NCU00907 [Neurospora crassa OR74A]EAA34446.1 hypothetical protein NCU00907 [Neurospora crassa OR74A]KHE82232.1 hypothetical protein GE21DRAFT_1793 [Neurospora crassa]CAE81991.1 hypothetical protein [Neurospora crassa]|eukprot:XP_963682.1 hypothetical protein NCU00907 [Neurospora crassa OR74A]